MSRDGGGVYSLPAGSTFVSGTVIDETKVNALTVDIESDLNLDRPVTAGGTGASTAAAARTNLGIKAPLKGIDTTGSANAYLFATSDSLTPSNGDTVVLVASFNNSGAATLDVDSGGAKDIKKLVAGSPTALVTGDIKSGAVYLLNYDSSATAWLIINPGGGDAPGAVIADAGGYFTGITIEAALQESAVLTQGQHTIWIPAGAMTTRTTAGAANGSSETSTNKIMIETLDFDPSTDEHAQFSILMPKSWNEGTLIFQAVMSHPATTTNFGVVFFMQAVALANDDALDTAFGTAVSVTDTGGTTDDVYISPESAVITVAGSPGAEELVYFQIYRDVSDGSDTMAVDARLHGVKVHYTTDANTDS